MRVSRTASLMKVVLDEGARRSCAPLSLGKAAGAAGRHHPACDSSSISSLQCHVSTSHVAAPRMQSHDKEGTYQLADERLIGGRQRRLVQELVQLRALDVDDHHLRRRVTNLKKTAAKMTKEATIKYVRNRRGDVMARPVDGGYRFPLYHPPLLEPACGECDSMLIMI